MSVLDVYKIEKKWTIPEIDAAVFLLNIDENKENINLEIIPKVQQENIARYKYEKDRMKRLLARSFLFEYCKECFNLRIFDFCFNEYKCPSFTHSDIKFSFSYAEKYVLVGISKNLKLGVDIEFKSTELEIGELANVIMHPMELEKFNDLAYDKEKIDFFYRVWSGKEALIKLMGKGLYYPITDINLSDVKQSKTSYIGRHQLITSNLLKMYSIGFAYAT